MSRRIPLTSEERALHARLSGKIDQPNAELLTQIISEQQFTTLVTLAYKNPDICGWIKHPDHNTFWTNVLTDTTVYPDAQRLYQQPSVAPLHPFDRKGGAYCRSITHFLISIQHPWNQPLLVKIKIQHILKRYPLKGAINHHWKLWLCVILNTSTLPNNFAAELKKPNHSELIPPDDALDFMQYLFSTQESILHQNFEAAKQSITQAIEHAEKHVYSSELVGQLKKLQRHLNSNAEKPVVAKKLRTFFIVLKKQCYEYLKTMYVEHKKMALFYMDFDTICDKNKKLLEILTSKTKPNNDLLEQAHKNVFAAIMFHGAPGLLMASHLYFSLGGHFYDERAMYFDYASTLLQQAITTGNMSEENSYELDDACYTLLGQSIEELKGDYYVTMHEAGYENFARLFKGPPVSNDEGLPQSQQLH